MLKLSVITINYNNSAGLEKTIKSVVSQTFSDFEYIVIDGGSTDESTVVIKKYSDKFTHWISEKDNGIYDAMNKGIRAAKGEYCLFLNSGDFLFDKDVFEKTFQSNHAEDIIYGNMMIDWGNGKITLGTMPDKITYHQMYTDTLWHPVSFIKKELFEKYGYYDESYRMVADYEFFFKTIIIHNVTTKHISLPISVYNMEGFSSKPDFKNIEKEERNRVLKTYLPQSVIDFSEEKNRESTIVAKENLISRIIKKI